MDHSTIVETAIAAFLCVLPAASNAQTDSAPVTASISSSAGNWDRPVQVALRFRIAPHWHLYWSNPGDAGLAPSITWKLPAGFRAATPRFPTPKKILTDGLVAYGYYDELILLTNLTPPRGYRPRERDTIQADVEWLVCLESCRPGHATLTLPCTATGRTREDALNAEALFARTAPVPWHGKADALHPATASRDGAGIELRFDAPLPAEDFFPDLIDNAVADHGSIHLDGRSISFHVQPSGPTAVISRLRGILIAGGKGYTIDLPVRYHQ